MTARGNAGNRYFDVENRVKWLKLFVNANLTLIFLSMNAEKGRTKRLRPTYKIAIDVLLQEYVAALSGPL